MQVALIVKPAGPATLNVVRRLREVHLASVSDILASITESLPVFTHPLFERADPDFPDRLLSLVRWLEDRSMTFKLYQIADGQPFDVEHADAYYVLDSQRLETIILTRRESLNQQLALGRLEDGISD